MDILTVGKKLDGREFSLHAIFTNVMISEKPARLGFFIDTSERERMQSRIAESEEKYRMFIEKAPLAFALTGPSNTIIEVNRAYCDLLDCGAESMIGMNPMDLMPFEDQELLRTKLPILQHRGTESMNCRLRKGDGTYVPVYVFSTVLPNGNTIAFIEDVTERMAYEEKLKVNEERLRSSELNFRTIFDRAALGIVTTNMKGIPIDFNDRFVEMIGYGPDEIRQKAFSDITHPDDVARNEELFQAIQAGTIDSYELEKRYIHKDGKSVWVHLFTSKLEGDQGQLEKVLTIIEDITERKRTEEALRNSEEKYSRLVAAIPDFVIRTDMKGNIVIVNEVTLSHSGYRLEDIKGHSLFSFIAAEDADKALKNAELMVGGKLGPVEYHFIMKDGRRILFEANGDVMREPSGIPTGLVFVCRDMTERRQLESKLRGANRRLRVMDKVTRHDTVNKLMSLQGYIDLIREGKNDIKDLHRLDRMDQVVSFLRDQANVTEDYHNIGVENPEWQSVKDICLRAASRVNLGDISLNVDVSDLEILADPLLYKVFYNLMDNSVRHGKTADCILVKAERFEDAIKITLTDNGIGISPNDKVNLFKEGYGKVHGLGLFLCREILDITGMTIIETGEPGNGVRFEISVPGSSFRRNDRTPQLIG